MTDPTELKQLLQAFSDGGKYISGYQWGSIAQSKESTFASANMVNPLQVIFNGRNVECLLSTMPHISASTHQLNIHGTWQDGDILRVGDGTSPAPQWVKTENGWVEI